MFYEARDRSHNFFKNHPNLVILLVFVAYYGITFCMDYTQSWRIANHEYEAALRRVEKLGDEVHVWDHAMEQHDIANSNRFIRAFQKTYAKYPLCVVMTCEDLIYTIIKYAAWNIVWILGLIYLFAKYSYKKGKKLLYVNYHRNVRQGDLTMIPEKKPFYFGTSEDNSLYLDQNYNKKEV